MPDHPDDEAVLPVQLAIANSIETYGLAGLLSGIATYVHSKIAVLKAVDSDRAYAWVGLAQLLTPVLAIARRLESDEERGR